MAVSLTDREHQQAAQCEETAGRYPGWHVWATREGSPVATRIGNPVFIDDGVWAQTIIADNWDELGQKLAEQASSDARRVPQAPI